MATERGRKSILVELNQLENLSWMANQISSAQESKIKKMRLISVSRCRGLFELRVERPEPISAP
jgi:hypothetical protein